MKKTSRLTLSRTTLRTLEGAELGGVQAGELNGGGTILTRVGRFGPLCAESQGGPTCHRTNTVRTRLSLDIDCAALP